MEPRAERTSDRVPLVAALALLVVPVVADLIVSRERRLFSYFAAGAFYYLLRDSRNAARSRRV